jgi:hypothetical protein
VRFDYRTWGEAREYARALGRCCGRAAHLVAITSPAENSCVFGIAQNLSRGGQVFIGLNNVANATEYVWDGTNLTVAAGGGGYVNWCTPENGGCQPTFAPAEGAQFCASMYGITGFWYSFGCSEVTDAFLFEYDCD